MEAVLTAAKFDLEHGGNTSPSSLRNVQAMADSAAQRSFEQLEKLAIQEILEGAANSTSVIAARVYIARAVAGMKLEMKRLPITTRPVTTLLREAEEEADGMSSEQSDSPHAYYDHCLLAAAFSEAGLSGRAVRLQERAVEGLSRIFGPKALEILVHKVCLAELKGPYSMDLEELHVLEQDLQTWYDSMNGHRDLASIKASGASTALDRIGRVKALICQKLVSVYGDNPAYHEDDTFSIAVNDTDRIIRRSLLQMERLGGVLDPATSQKSRQIYVFLKTMGPMVEAGEFAFKRATTLLEATSHCKFLSLSCAQIITDGIRVFVQHHRVRPICERILLRLLHNLRTQGTRRDTETSFRVIWSTLQLLRATRAHDPGLNTPLQTAFGSQHYAIYDICRHVRYLGQPQAPHPMER